MMKHPWLALFLHSREEQLDVGLSKIHLLNVLLCLGKQLGIICIWIYLLRFVESWFSSRPPSGCLQYYYQQATGRITTFNFQTDQSTHLANQRYNICIQRLAGKKFINWLISYGYLFFFLISQDTYLISAVTLQNSMLKLDAT